MKRYFLFVWKRRANDCQTPGPFCFLYVAQIILTKKSVFAQSQNTETGEKVLPDTETTKQFQRKYSGGTPDVTRWYLSCSPSLSSFVSAWVGSLLFSSTLFRPYLSPYWKRDIIQKSVFLSMRAQKSKSIFHNIVMRFILFKIPIYTSCLNGLEYISPYNSNLSNLLEPENRWIQFGKCSSASEIEKKSIAIHPLIEFYIKLKIVHLLKIKINEKLR